MTRRCSHCSTNGHNARTCPSRASISSSGGVRLFGVSLTEGVGPMAMKKSASTSCLSSASAGAGSGGGGGVTGGGASDGYLSDDPVHAATTSCSLNCRAERKKGTPWTEEEHKMFLIGLQKLGKGDWRGIARNYVISRTPTQVASHAQKYFLRQSNVSRRKRRSSLFDMHPDMPSDPITPTAVEMPVPNPTQQPELIHVPPIPPPYYTPVIAPPYPHPVWYQSPHEVVKPVPVHVDEVESMSKLHISDVNVKKEPVEQPGLTLKLFEPSGSRKSAFHASPPISIPLPDLNNNTGNAIHAV